MKTETVLITPRMALDWLKRNTDNRPLRRAHVDALRFAFERGEWKLTHAGIAFDKTGKLIDGQHRLHMIAGLPGDTQVPMSVTRDADPASFTVIDQGCKRSTSDVFGVTTDLASCARFIAKLAISNGSAMSMDMIRPFIDYVEPEHAALESFCPMHVKFWSAAPVRSAAVIQMKRGHDADFVLRSYHALVHSDVDAAPYAARALMQQRLNGTIASARSSDLFCRSLRVFDSTQRGKISKILVRDQDGALEEVREFVRRQMKKAPAFSAGAKVAKPAPNSTPLKAVAA